MVTDLQMHLQNLTTQRTLAVCMIHPIDSPVTMDDIDAGIAVAVRQGTACASTLVDTVLPC